MDNKNMIVLITRWDGEGGGLILSRSNKNNKQPKSQASRDSKVPTSTKCTKKPAKAKTPSPPPLSSFLHQSSHNRTDNYLTDHSFYQSEANLEPTEEQCAKKGKATKEPTSSYLWQEERGLQADLKELLPSSPSGSSPLLSSNYQDEQEDYTKKFKATGHPQHL
ncbi:hypothetical protein DSO57_1013133 [Entomophthora muscae]|uniref:Uncharacterized protein n=1 Tax=Entomophthora muscae TaxID=34485 RepID=A0ACC2SUZ3_9FUNG|nr:hypothetical protein DSO57_1013133 [Entomophthora muscae]